MTNKQTNRQKKLNIFGHPSAGEIHNPLSKSNKILTPNTSWNEVQTLQILWKSRKGYAPTGVYIPHFGQIWVKISILGVLHPCRCTTGGEIWHRSPPPCNVSPLRGEKPQNRPLSKLNTGRFLLRAMLPVKIALGFLHCRTYFAIYAYACRVTTAFILLVNTSFLGNQFRHFISHPFWFGSTFRCCCYHRYIFVFKFSNGTFKFLPTQMYISDKQYVPINISELCSNFSNISSAVI